MSKKFITPAVIIVLSIILMVYSLYIPGIMLIILAATCIISFYYLPFKYVYKRAKTFLPTILIIITMSFFLMRAAPGGPFDQERPMNAATKANLMKIYGMDKPLYEQYFIYLKNLSKGDFGPSLSQRGYSVNELIATGLSASLTLGGLAIGFAIILGVLAGLYAAINKNSKFDYIIMSFSMIGVAVPNFVISPLLALIIGVYLGWLPVAGWENPLYYILPVIGLALPQIATIARLTRGSMIEMLTTNYVRTARAKGLSETIVIFRHVLKGGLLPVLSYLGPAIAAVATGSFVIENIFNIPGIGRYFVTSALNRDYPMVLGVMIFYAVFLMVMNFIVDMLYSVLDPKVSTGDQ